jgi:predicted GNAT family acetyltransferase
MAGLIRDNGLVSFANRGVFYGCRDQANQLSGVALIGAKTVIEARDKVALEVFANLIPNNLTDHLVRGERQPLEYILARYAEADRVPRLVTQELLLEQKAAATGVVAEPNLRLAFREDLESVVLINAALGYEESGVDPLVRDWDGMWRRAVRRVDQGRVWVLIEDGRMIFKADVISETPETLYLEGVYVQPEFRRKGYGLRCMNQLARNLLGRVGSLCLVVNEENQRAQDFYGKLGYENRGYYSTAYFSAV